MASVGIHLHGYECGMRAKQWSDNEIDACVCVCACINCSTKRLKKSNDHIQIQPFFLMTKTSKTRANEQMNWQMLAAFLHKIIILARELSVSLFFSLRPFLSFIMCCHNRIATQREERNTDIPFQISQISALFVGSLQMPQVIMTDVEAFLFFLFSI